MERQKWILISVEVDDANLTCAAFRVYGHISRLMSSCNHCKLDEADIAAKCFRASYPSSTPEHLEDLVDIALKELEQKNLIEVEIDQENSAKIYTLI